MADVVLTKAQRKALRELSRGVTTFGAGMMYHNDTLDVLVNLGYAEVIDKRRLVCPSESKYRMYTKARITPNGKNKVRFLPYL